MWNSTWPGPDQLHRTGVATTATTATTAEAVITDRVRPGVVSAQSVWWGKLTADKSNANQTTSQRITDLGNGPVFYDNQVEIEVR